MTMTDLIVEFRRTVPTVKTRVLDDEGKLEKLRDVLHDANMCGTYEGVKAMVEKAYILALELSVGHTQSANALIELDMKLAGYTRVLATEKRGSKETTEEEPKKDDQPYLPGLEPPVVSPSNAPIPCGPFGPTIKPAVQTGAPTTVDPFRDPVDGPLKVTACVTRGDDAEEVVE